MSSSVPSAASGHMIPGLLTDSTCDLIIPTMVPPATDFPDIHRSDLAGEEPSSSQRNVPVHDANPQIGREDHAQHSYYNQDRDDSDSSSSSDDDEESTNVREAQKDQRQKPSNAAGTQINRQYKGLRGEKNYGRLNVGNEHYRTKARVDKTDGRLNISVNETNHKGYLAKVFGQVNNHHLNIPHRHGNESTKDEEKAEEEEVEGMNTPQDDDDAASFASSVQDKMPRPRLNIVIMVIGSRGDIQPFLQVGKILKEKYGHRVRIATHPAFRDFVSKDIGLEFFSIGGDPSELMAFMVKNPGLIPKLETVRHGEISKRRNDMAEMFEGFWRACTNETDGEKDSPNNKMMEGQSPFVAHAIIANPPSYAHAHIAERLGIPLHMMFTFPYTPTSAFPSPMSMVEPSKSNVDTSYVNFMSYTLVEMLVWQGLGDLVNKFRVKTLGLEPVSSLWGPGALHRMKVPYTYMWSPKLLGKPKDWGPEIDITGYVFLDLATNYKPPQDLQDFLDAGEPPVYIGFGSIVIDDPERFTELIFSAVKKAGVRALVSKGWGGLGDNDNTPDNIFMLDNIPHDWLFPRVKAVVHHGGCGTTAIGLKLGKPTMIVPFFGDQPFWGAMVAEHEAGAKECIPYKKLTVDNMAEGIKQCLTDEAQRNVQKLADSIEREGDGAENAVKSFLRSLPLAGKHSMRCSILEERVAVWRYQNSYLRLSALAAEILMQEKKIKLSDLHLLRHYEWDDFDGPGEPISGASGALLSTGTHLVVGVGRMPVDVGKHITARTEHNKRKKAHQKKRDERGAQRPEGKAVGSDAAPNSGSAGGRPSGPAHTNTDTTTSTTLSSDPEDGPAMGVAKAAGGGLEEAATALASSPLDFALALAQGVHNAPRLYGDASVRRPIRITGMRSGVRAAGKELVFGVYDGVTGLVTQPVNGWKEGKTVGQKLGGLGRGLAFGFGGFVLKDISAIITPPAFLAHGLRKQISRQIHGPGANGPLHAAHVAQGQADYKELPRTEHDEHNLKRTKQRVDYGWGVMEEVWDMRDLAHSHGNVKDRWKMSRTKQAWQDNGAMENIGATSKALEARKHGEDMERLFAQRRRELAVAEAPRASVMDQPKGYDEAANVAPNGQPLPGVREESTTWELNLPEAVGETPKPGTSLSATAPDRVKDEDGSSDAKAVASSDGGANERMQAVQEEMEQGHDDNANLVGHNHALEHSKVSV